MPHIQHTIPSSGGGAVTSVAGRTGVVTLTAADVGAGTWPGAVKAGAALRLGTQTISGTATLVTGTADVILADTTSAAFTITLPAAPTAGDIFIFVDSAGQWATNNLTLALNGKNLNASASNAVLTQVNGTFGIYYDGTAWHSIIHAPSDTNPVMDGTAAPGTAFGYSRRDHVHPSDTSRAPLASPTFTGTVVLPEGNDAAAGTASRRTLGTGATQAMQGSLAAPLASPTFTGTPTLPTGTILTTQATSDSSTKAASTAYVKSQVAAFDRIHHNAPLFATFNAAPTGVKLPTLLKPIFSPVVVPVTAMTLADFGIKIQAANAGQTVGAAIYSIVYSGAGTYSASLVAQLNVAVTTASAALVTSAVTTGAAGSGAAPVTLDFVANRYVVGLMQSEITTSSVLGTSIAVTWAGMGILSWTAAARSSTTDWPSSFTQTSGVAITGTTAVPIVELVTATGAFFL